MGITARTVTEDVTFLWDGVTQRLAKGQVLAVAAGGALERAIGLHRLTPHGAPAAAPEPLLAGGLITEAEAPHFGETGPAAAAQQGETAGETPYSEPPADTIAPAAATAPKPAAVKKPAAAKAGGGS
jgi:hypothetical protein